MAYPKVLYTTLLGLFLISSTACHRYYTADDFDRKTNDHEVIAVLPFEIRMTGRIPKELTEEQIQAIEAAESRAFQSSFVHQILAKGNRGKYTLRVDVQAVETTNSILQENGIELRDSWREDPQKMAELLGVDAVVRSKVIKQRYLSDLESIGVEVLGTVLNSIFGGPLWFGFAKTADVNLTVSLVDRKNSNILFSTDQNIEVDWSQPANQAIDNICRRVARRMPYSQKRK